ncbi:H-NS histone family protein [Comamonas thiooxydans]|uniref:H-NS histone family protein n=1 Tax=Comamonas thiooxydans TaxID=363952 RepID=UPI000B4087FB|nr:H-NS histone family protein [Comamonas thiooxydans]
MSNAAVSVKELLAQRAKLDEQISALQKEERGAAIESVRETIANYNLTVDECFSTPRKGKGSRSGVVVQAKYRNNETGQTWSGRGKPPLWIADKNRDDFLIDKSAA